MVTSDQKGRFMSNQRPALPAADEIRQANSLFLHFLRSRPALAVGQFGLSPRVTEILKQADLEHIDQAADFPRALFRIRVPAECSAQDAQPVIEKDGSRQILQATLFLSAWSICRMSGYAARMLLRLDDDEVHRLRHAQMKDILQMSLNDNVMHAAFDDLDWIWNQLLTESRPECRQQLVLLGLQPGLSLGSFPR